ncbi:hypothetical protein [Aliiglaciecola litoralis]|uniref:Uncharacterized protein n=1 Tax=Aliiglaciecola litoralis TaxID=582857 RepID=A0ABN1LDN8_9ALTE
MFKYLCLSMALIGGACQAEENFVAQSVNWLKSGLPESVNVEFQKSRIKFNGCKHREYVLALTQPLSKNFSLEGGVTYAKGQLNWGINNQKISLKRYSFLPRYQISQTISVSAGMVLQSAPEFKTSQGFELNLPKSKIYMFSSRFEGVRDEHQVEIALSSHKWDATNEFGTLFANGLVDNKLNVSYSAFF